MDDKIEAWVQRAIELADLYGKASYQSLENHGELGDSFDEEQALRAHLRTTPEGYRLVPVEPTPGKLMSMAIRDDHGLGMPGYYDQPLFTGATHAQRLSAAIARARQAHEEVVGVGFYRESKEQEYADLLAASQESGT